MIRILVVERILLMCEVIAAALEDEPNIVETGIATSAEQALQQLAEVEYNMVLISTGLPEGQAISLTERITTDYPEIKVLILGMINTQAVILRYIEAGAAGYVFREDSVDELLKNVRAIFEERALIAPEIAASLMERVSTLTHELVEQGVDPDHYEELTPREREILELVEDGMTNQEIATKLTIELGTVKNHVHNILSKLNVNSRKDAATYLTLIKTEQPSSQIGE